jgi:hypothetical protein
MHYILMKDEGQLVLSSKIFDRYDDAVEHVKTIAPSREPFIVEWVAGVEYNEKTGEGTLNEPRCHWCKGRRTGSGWHCPNCGGC